MRFGISINKKIHNIQCIYNHRFKIKLLLLFFLHFSKTSFNIKCVLGKNWGEQLIFALIWIKEIYERFTMLSSIFYATQMVFL